MLARALPLLLVAALAFPAVASAHASFVRSDPSNGDVLQSAPRVVRVHFDDDVRAASGIKAIRNGDGSVLGEKPRVVGGRVLVVPLREDLRDGDYTVLWRVVSDDGHTLAGVIAFGVGAGRAPPAAALSVSNSPSVKDVISRWLFFAGLLTAAGAAFFRLAIGPVPTRLFLGSFLLAFVGVSGAVHDVSLSTRFGAVMAAAAVIAGCGALLAAIAPLFPRIDILPSLAGLALLPTPSFAGHALDSGRPRLMVVVDVAHVGAASLWLGGLVALALALRSPRAAGRRELVQRFSGLALISVVVLGATGVIRAVWELDSFSQLWTTGYGRVLIVKTALLAALIGLGWVNRFLLLPRWSVDGLRRTVATELALFAVLVGAVALLTDLRPGRDRVASAASPAISSPPPLPARRMVVLARQDGDFAVALAYRAPGAEVTVLGPDGLGVNGLRVTIAGATARSCGAGCYGALVAPAATVRVTIDGRPFEFTVPEQLRSAMTLLSRATRAFRSLRSVDYVERLASSPRNRVVADFTLEEPDRLEYRIRGGASGIIIGARRWDREPRGRWVPSPQQPTGQPEPIWAGPVTNVYLLRATRSTYVVSFLKPIGPAWFSVVLDRRTLLPRKMTMTAAAHFMTHRYVGFNAPRRIIPPKS